MKNTIKRLRLFNRWRLGEDERTFESLEISAEQIGKDIEFVCNMLEEYANLVDELLMKDDENWA
jgi:hypothetical protein